MLEWGGEKVKHHNIKWSGQVGSYWEEVRRKKNYPAPILTASVFKIIKLHVLLKFLQVIIHLKISNSNSHQAIAFSKTSLLKCSNSVK